MSDKNVSLLKAKENAKEKWKEALYFYVLLTYLEMTNKNILDALTPKPSPILIGSNHNFKNITDEFSYFLSAFSNACYSCLEYLKRTRKKEIKTAVREFKETYGHIYGDNSSKKAWRKNATHIHPIKPDAAYVLPGPAGIVAALMGIHDKSDFSESIMFCSKEKDENGEEATCQITAECLHHLNELYNFIESL